MDHEGRYGSVQENRSRGEARGSIISLPRNGWPGAGGELSSLRAPCEGLPPAQEKDPEQDDEGGASSPSTASFSSGKKAAFLVGALSTIVLIVGGVVAYATTPALVNFGNKSPTAPEYDFIVVGGGPAGSVLAKHMSDDLHNRVLLLEAGMPSQYELGGQDFLSDPLTPFDIPLMWSSVSHMKDFHWEVLDHTKTEHPNALVAKALGGCGIHNAMLYVRGLDSDFAKWDVEGFDYESALETWKRLENYTGPGPLPEWHGRGGPISTTPPSFIDEVAPFFLASCKEAGIRLTDDFNKPGGRHGAGYFHFAVKNGVRDSASRAMLGEVIMGKDVRTNLDIFTGAHVSRVLIEGGTQVLNVDDVAEEKGSASKPAAVGVEYMLEGRLETARIAAPGSRGREGAAVIVTAGALHTPKLLMKSGIGDKAELKSQNLGCIAHVPGVGKNLQDHASVGVMYMLGPDILKLMPSAYTVAQELERYKMEVLKAFDLGFPPGVTIDGVDTDALTNGEANAPSIFSSAGLSAGAFLQSPYPPSHPSGENFSAPDIQLTTFPRVTEPHILALANIRPSAQAPPMMLVTVSVLDPEGRSVVRLDPENPNDGNPYIHRDEREGAPEPLTELDARKLAWGVRQVRRIMDTSPLRELHRGEVYPGPGVSGKADDAAGESEALVSWVRGHLYSNSHWCGTARMGALSDPQSVVDEKMGVRGVRGLYVGDASVIPFIPNGNVHSTVVLVAMKLAGFLLGRASRVRKGTGGDDEEAG